MNVFIDTSALYAVLDADDAHHPAAGDLWKKIIEGGSRLVCHNYILVETSALVQRRLGSRALREFEAGVVPVLDIVWIDAGIHNAAVSAQLALLAAARRGRRAPSLVDCVSFEVMRRAGMRAAFAFDPHFEEFGFEILGL
jgi:predicted nucleic acid-binding protein